MSFPPQGSASSSTWTKLETLKPSAASSATTGTLTAYDEYLVYFQLRGSTQATLQLQLNGDTGTNYAERYINDSETISVASSQNEVLIVTIDSAFPGTGILLIQGVTAAVASGEGAISISASGRNNDVGIEGRWQGGNATQVSTITLKPSTGNFTGNISVFGRNY